MSNGSAKNPKQGGRYQARGVSATKTEVHAIVDGLDPGLFPKAFCKITEDYLAGDPQQCNVMHSDGSGTKSIIAYLAYREGGDPSVFRGIAQDSIVMNLDDLLCVGASSRILISSTINRNARHCPGEVVSALIRGSEDFLAQLKKQGIDIHSGGGETADVGDLTGAIVVDSCAVAIMPRQEVISGDRIRPGLVIVGLASDGQATYEEQENSGIGSNGLTSARHDLLSSCYRDKYPETFDAGAPRHLIYCGPYQLDDPLPESSLSIGQALLSPTRTYAPLIHKLLRQQPGLMQGLVHCSGGAQTKCLRFGRDIHFIKDQLFPPPPIFKAIQSASHAHWKEMYQVFNMGHRMEIYCAEGQAEAVIAAAAEFNIAARVIGRTERSAKGNRLSLHHGNEVFSYH